MKFVLSTLSFFTKDAIEWARCYIENVADRRVIFTNLTTQMSSWTKFWKQFKQWFELANADISALLQLQALRQDNKRFVEFIAEFETLSA